MKVETLKFEPGVGLLLEGGRCDAYMAALSRTVDLAVSAQKPRLCAQGCMLLRSMPTCASCDVFGCVSCMSIIL
jgi:hypothetical protein